MQIDFLFVSSRLLFAQRLFECLWLRVVYGKVATLLIGCCAIVKLMIALESKKPFTCGDRSVTVAGDRKKCMDREKEIAWRAPGRLLKGSLRKHP